MDYEIFDAMPEGGSVIGRTGPKRGHSKYPLAMLGVGQMIFLATSQNVGRSAATVASKRTGFAFNARKGEYKGVTGTWVERTE